MSKEHECCPTCGGEMEVVGPDEGYQRLNRPIRNGWGLFCEYCNLWFGWDALDYGGVYEDEDGVWYDWDTGISEQRGKWVEAHACDGCVFPPGQ